MISERAQPECRRRWSKTLLIPIVYLLVGSSVKHKTDLAHLLAPGLTDRSSSSALRISRHDTSVAGPWMASAKCDRPSDGSRLSSTVCAPFALRFRHEARRRIDVSAGADGDEKVRASPAARRCAPCDRASRRTTRRRAACRHSERRPRTWSRAKDPSVQARVARRIARTAPS